MKRFAFSWKISLICGVLILFMLRLSYWQWERYLDKEVFLAELDSRLKQEIVPFPTLLPIKDPSKLLHRRVQISGIWDFDHELVKRNRKDNDDGPGVHVITPLHLDNDLGTVLVNRGYLPLSVQSKDARIPFQENAPKDFVGLIKLSETPRWSLSPSDPPAGGDKPWIDAWLRVNIEEIQKQLPYKLLPVQIEMIRSTENESLKDELVQNSKSREEIFYLTDTAQKVRTGALNPNRVYPHPAFSTVVPSATHLLYVFEWIFMALLTVAIGIILQLRRNRA